MSKLSPDQIQTEICTFLSSLLGEPCSPRDDLPSRGVDSIALLELVIFIEKQLGIPLPLELITSQPLTTVAELTTRVLAIKTDTPREA